MGSGIAKLNLKIKVVSDSLRPHELYSPWNSLGQNTGVGSLFLLQGIIPTQGSKLGVTVKVGKKCVPCLQGESRSLVVHCSGLGGSQVSPCLPPSCPPKPQS